MSYPCTQEAHGNFLNNCIIPVLQQFWIIFALIFSHVFQATFSLYLLKQYTHVNVYVSNEGHYKTRPGAELQT